jgi:hypothetical protein
MRLVKSEDLNHHGTLFAGRTAEWFVESGFLPVFSGLYYKVNYKTNSDSK